MIGSASGDRDTVDTASAAASSVAAWAYLPIVFIVADVVVHGGLFLIGVVITCHFSSALVAGWFCTPALIYRSMLVERRLVRILST